MAPSNTPHHHRGQIQIVRAELGVVSFHRLLLLDHRVVGCLNEQPSIHFIISLLTPVFDPSILTRPVGQTREFWSVNDSITRLGFVLRDNKP